MFVFQSVVDNKKAKTRVSTTQTSVDSKVYVSTSIFKISQEGGGGEV